MFNFTLFFGLVYWVLDWFGQCHCSISLPSKIHMPGWCTSELSLSTRGQCSYMRYIWLPNGIKKTRGGAHIHCQTSNDMNRVGIFTVAVFFACFPINNDVSGGRGIGRSSIANRNANVSANIYGIMQYYSIMQKLFVAQNANKMCVRSSHSVLKITLRNFMVA